MNKFLLSVLLILGLGLNQKVEASHLAAADIYYDYLGPNYYKVHLILYRDCTGIPVGSTATVCAKSYSCNLSFNIPMDTTGANDPLNGTFVDQLCPGIPSFCNGGTFPGYQYFHYVGTTLGLMFNACVDWHFVYNSCCRNGQIQNIGTSTAATPPYTSGGVGMNVYCTLDNVNFPTNNSARFMALPIPYVCVNNQTVFQNIPFDPDGDSLYVYAATPKDDDNCDSGAYVLFTGTNTEAVPLPVTAAGYIVNPSLGNATFTPTLVDNFVLAFRANEYDNASGNKKAMILRDVQIAVLNCASPPPAPIFNSNVTGGIVASTNPPTVTVCPGTPLTINAFGVSQSGSNSIFAYANNLQISPTTTFSANPPAGGNDTVTTNFTWTPTVSDIGNHILVITFADSTCSSTQPIVLKSYLTILITVQDGVDAGGPYQYCPGGTPAQLYASGPGNVVSWLWTDLSGNTSGIGLNNNIIPNPLASPAVTTQYIVTGIDTGLSSGCSLIDTITVNVFPQTIVNAGIDQVICANETATLNSSVSSPGGSYSWLPNYTISSTTAASPIVTPLVDTTYVLTYTDLNNCVFRDSVKVDINGIKAFLNPIKSDDNICPGVPFQLFANAIAQPCGFSQINCSGPTLDVIIGTNTTLSNNNSPFAENAANGFRVQYLYTVNELKAMGVKPGNIKELGFYVDSKSSGNLNQFNINMACTNLTSLDAALGFVAGTNPVYYASSYNSSVGLNNFVLNGDGYFWDGVQNLVVELCYIPSFGALNAYDIVQQTNTPYISSMMQYSTINPPCNMAYGIIAAQATIAPMRPDIKVVSCVAGDYNFSWSPAAPLTTPTSENPSANNGVASTTIFTVIATSTTNSNCTNSNTITLNIDQTSKIEAFAAPTYICEPGLVNLTSLVTGLVPTYSCGEENVPCLTTPANHILTGVAPYSSTVSPFQSTKRRSRTQILYTAAELAAAGVTVGNITNIGFDISNNNAPGFIYYDFSVKMGCVPASLTTLTNYYDYFKLKPVYYNSTYSFLPPNDIPLDIPFLWDGTSNLIVDICFDNVGQSMLGLNDDVFVYNTPTVQYLNDATTVNFGTNLCQYPYQGTSSFSYTSNFKPVLNITSCTVKPKTFDYVWKPQYLIYDSSAQNTQAFVTGTTIYTVSTVTGSKCPVSDTVSVTLLDHNIWLSTNDTNICAGDAIQLYAYGSGTGGTGTFQWYPSTGLSCSNCDNPIVQVAATTVYTVVRTDVYGCTDTSQVIVRVNANPSVSISNSINGIADSVHILFNQTVQLNALGAGLTMFNWVPAWGLSNPNYSTTIASPTEPSMYYIFAKDSFNCLAMDSVFVNIIYDDSIAVPNIFSPNGDGINDVFKVIHNTYKSIQEFRVFDRWGNEIFTAKDNKGWNGTFRGKRCDLGTYHYLIRVAYPDGKTKMLKGDVILLE